MCIANIDNNCENFTKASHWLRTGFKAIVVPWLILVVINTVFLTLRIFIGIARYQGISPHTNLFSVTASTWARMGSRDS